MTPDLIAQIRLALPGQRSVLVDAELQHELLDRCEAAEAFGLACIELAAAERVAWNAEGGGTRLTAAEENHKVTGERFADLCIPQEVPDVHGR